MLIFGDNSSTKDSALKNPPFSLGERGKEGHISKFGITLLMRPRQCRNSMSRCRPNSEEAAEHTLSCVETSVQPNRERIRTGGSAQRQTPCRNQPCCEPLITVECLDQNVKRDVPVTQDHRHSHDVLLTEHITGIVFPLGSLCRQMLVVRCETDSGR